MRKQVIIINGRGGAGKDTLCTCASQFYRTRNVSSITPIVEIARTAGWDGEKTKAARRMLSRLKEVFTEFNDLPYHYCLAQYQEFLKTDEELLFLHVREPEEIARLKQAIGADCHTLLVRRPGGEVYGNRSDDEVENYAYDFYFMNDLPLEQLSTACENFFKKIFKTC